MIISQIGGTQIRGSDMSKNEIPKIDPVVQELIGIYGPTVTRIGINQVRTARLDAFVGEYLSHDADPIPIGHDDYSQRRVGMVTLSGVMAHARLHQYPHTVSGNRQHLLVIDSYASTDPTEFWTADSTEPGYGGIGRQQTVVTANTLVKLRPTLTSVDDFGHDDGGENVHDDVRERTIEFELARISLPQMSWGTDGWFVRVGAEALDIGHDALDVHRRVHALREDPIFGVIDRSATSTAVLQRTGSDT